MIEAVFLVLGCALLLHIHRTRIRMRQLEAKISDSPVNRLERAFDELTEDIDRDWRLQVEQVQEYVDNGISAAATSAQQIIERKVVGRIRQLTNETVRRHIDRLSGKEMPHEKFKREQGGVEFQDPRDGEWKDL